jgi:hypothetical protein
VNRVRSAAGRPAPLAFCLVTAAVAGGSLLAMGRFGGEWLVFGCFAAVSGFSLSGSV